MFVHKLLLLPLCVGVYVGSCFVFTKTFAMTCGESSGGGGVIFVRVCEPVFETYPNRIRGFQ